MTQLAKTAISSQTVTDTVTDVNSRVVA